MVSKIKERWLPVWTLKSNGIIGPEERLPWPQTLVMGFQHVVAMFGGTILAPLIMGFNPNISLLFSGIGTLIFFLIVGGRVPSYVGSSFSFIAVVIAATGYAGSGPNPHIAVALGGILAAGALYLLIGLVVVYAGYRWIEKLMPPVWETRLPRLYPPARAVRALPPMPKTWALWR
jgi:putative pyrimidine permease RutG